MYKKCYKSLHKLCVYLPDCAVECEVPHNLKYNLISDLQTSSSTDDTNVHDNFLLNKNSYLIFK